MKKISKFNKKVWIYSFIGTLILCTIAIGIIELFIFLFI